MPPSGPAADIETAIDHLYQLPLEAFVPERNALASALRKAGDREAADRVKGLAKPSATAWAVNQAWWTARETFDAMLAAAAAMREAQQGAMAGRAVDIRAASYARQQAVAPVVDAASAALGDTTPDARRRILGTCDTLATTGFPEGVAPGRLTQDLQTTGLDLLAALAASAGATPAPTGKAPSPPPVRNFSIVPRPAAPARTKAPKEALASPDAVAAARQAHAARVEAATRDVAAHQRACDEATREAERADRRLRDVEAVLGEAAGRVAALEQELEQARRALIGARGEATTAREAAAAAERERERLARTLERAKEALAKLSHDASSSLSPTIR